MKKYGIEHFHISLIEETENPEEREKYWIEKFNSFQKGYNATLGGDGKHYLDYDKIINEYKKCHNQKTVAEQLGITTSTVHKVLLSNHINIVVPLKKTCKKVQMKSQDSENIEIFVSCGEAARALIARGITSAKVNTVTSKITDCCNGRRKSAYHCFWEFLE